MNTEISAPQWLPMSSWRLLWCDKLSKSYGDLTHFPQGSITVELYTNHAPKVPKLYTADSESRALCFLQPDTDWMS